MLACQVPLGSSEVTLQEALMFLIDTPVLPFQHECLQATHVNLQIQGQWVDMPSVTKLSHYSFFLRPIIFPSWVSGGQSI